MPTGWRLSSFSFVYSRCSNFRFGSLYKIIYNAHVSISAEFCTINRSLNSTACSESFDFLFSSLFKPYVYFFLLSWFGVVLLLLLTLIILSYSITGFTLCTSFCFSLILSLLIEYTSKRIQF